MKILRALSYVCLVTGTDKGSSKLCRLPGMGINTVT